MSKTVEKFDIIDEIKYLKAKTNRLERYYHSNLKYIKQLYAKIDKLEKMHCGDNNGTDK